MYSDYYFSRNHPILSSGESIIWRGKPKRSVFILTKSLTLMPLALLWLCLDLGFLVSLLPQGELIPFIIPFFALHLMPVWIWLGNVLSAGRRWKNTAYFITNRRIIIQSGFFAVNEVSLFYKDILNAQLRIGLLDKLCHTADIIFDDGHTVHTNRVRINGKDLNGFVFEDLEDGRNVYSTVQKVIMDMQTDIEFPNAYRPAENPGYNTNYRSE